MRLAGQIHSSRRTGSPVVEHFLNDHHRLPPDWPGTLNELCEIFEAPYAEATLVKLGTSTVAG